MPPRLDALVVCTPGLEGVVADELADLGLRTRTPVAGGVPVGATTRQLYLACHRARTATRVLVRVARFEARTFAELEAGAAEVDWARWLAVGTARRWRVTCRRSRLHHSGAVAERVADAAHRAVPGPSVAGASTSGEGDGGSSDATSVDDGAQPFVVRVSRDVVTISVDACGEGLHRRGWRLATAKAPLRPTLAAAALAGIGWCGATPLVDPLCGSGTLAIEAALLARRLPPLVGRSLALEHWPSFEPGTWASVVGADRTDARHRSPVALVAADRDAGAAQAARANAARAGVADDVAVLAQPLSALAPPDGGPGWLVTNPPWGRRVGGGPSGQAGGGAGRGSGGDLRDLYATLGNLVRGPLEGWGLALLVPDAALAGHTGLRLEERWRTTSGGHPLRLLATDGPAG